MKYVWFYETSIPSVPKWRLKPWDALSAEDTCCSPRRFSGKRLPAPGPGPGLPSGGCCRYRTQPWLPAGRLAVPLVGLRETLSNTAPPPTPQPARSSSRASESWGMFRSHASTREGKAQSSLFRSGLQRNWCSVRSAAFPNDIKNN